MALIHLQYSTGRFSCNDEREWILSDHNLVVRLIRLFLNPRHTQRHFVSLTHTVIHTNTQPLCRLVDEINGQIEHIVRHEGRLRLVDLNLLAKLGGYILHYFVARKVLGIVTEGHIDEVVIEGSSRLPDRQSPAAAARKALLLRWILVRVAIEASDVRARLALLRRCVAETRQQRDVDQEKSEGRHAIEHTAL